MKILWVKSDFLHPTTRGGQIRTLEMLRRRAYSPAQFESLVAESPFQTCAMRSEGIGLEVKLVKRDLTN